jgi:hypothetical protein
MSVSEKVLDKVRKLIALAEHPNTGDAEREAFLAKADQMMTQHAIDEAMLALVDPARKTEPITERFEFVSADHKWFGQFRSMMVGIVAAGRCKGANHYDGTITLVGYRDDVEYVKMVWLSVYMGFVAKLDPTWDASKTEDSNVKTLKDAGWKWERIAAAGGFDWPDGGKLKRAYRRECARLGVEPVSHTQRHEAYRNSFADSFVAEVRARLRRMQSAGQQTVRDAKPGAELALRDRSESVNEAYWMLFPNLRPLTPEQEAEQRAKWAAEDAAEQAQLDAMTPAERAAYDREEAKQEAKRERDYERWNRNNQRAQRRLYDEQGWEIGAKAGQQVDLSGGRNNVGGRTTHPGLEG